MTKEHNEQINISITVTVANFVVKTLFVFTSLSETENSMTIIYGLLHNYQNFGVQNEE